MPLFRISEHSSFTASKIFLQWDIPWHLPCARVRQKGHSDYNGTQIWTYREGHLPLWHITIRLRTEYEMSYRSTTRSALNTSYQAYALRAIYLIRLQVSRLLKVIKPSRVPRCGNSGHNSLPSYSGHYVPTLFPLWRPKTCAIYESYLSKWRVWAAEKILS